MTLQGTVNKSALLLALLMLSAFYVWRRFAGSEAPQGLYPWMMAGMLGGLVMALVTTFKKEWSPLTAPLYALLEGLAIGGISLLFEARFPGVVLQAVGLTFGTFAALLVIYKSRLVRVTDNFRLGVAAATGGIFLIYLLTWILGFFHIQVPYLHQGGLIGIGFSLFVLVVAALNLVLDFDFIEAGAARGAPKYFEWYAGFGLLVTLVWLYVEFLRLLGKLRERR